MPSINAATTRNMGPPVQKHVIGTDFSDSSWNAQYFGWGIAFDSYLDGALCNAKCPI
jgi:hypothetical protein